MIINLELINAVKQFILIVPHFIDGWIIHVLEKKSRFRLFMHVNVSLVSYFSPIYEKFWSGQIYSYLDIFIFSGVNFRILSLIFVIA